MKPYDHGNEREGCTLGREFAGELERETFRM
jgi:hypothetical protein